MTGRAAATLVVAVGLAVGAGASIAASRATGAAAATSTKPKACAVLRRAEIREVVGQPVKRSLRDQVTPRSASICNWDVGGRDSGALVSVWVQRGRAAREGFDVSVRVFGIGGEPVPELGGAAFYSSEAGAAYALRGSEFVYVQRLDQTDEVDDTVLRDQAVTLTKLALQRV